MIASQVGLQARPAEPRRPAEPATPKAIVSPGTSTLPSPFTASGIPALLSDVLDDDVSDMWERWVMRRGTVTREVDTSLSPHIELSMTRLAPEASSGDPN